MISYTPYIALQVTKHPRTRTCVNGERVDLSVSAIGAEPLRYKWKMNGEDITSPEFSGTNFPTLTIYTFSQTHQGNYTCVVSNNQKSVQSEAANLALGTNTIHEVTLFGACDL